MGSCCVSDSSLLGEQFIREILSDESFVLRNYTYMELLNEIVSKRVEQEIPKEHVKQFLFPEFYDANNKYQHVHLYWKFYKSGELTLLNSH